MEVKYTGWYELSSFVNKEGKTVAKATLLDNQFDCDHEWNAYLIKGENFEGVVSDFHPTENDLRGDSACPLFGYNIFGRRIFRSPRQSRRNRG